MNCLSCDYGPSIYDIRHNVAVNAVYELPFGPGKTFLNDSGAWARSSEAGNSVASVFGIPDIR